MTATKKLSAAKKMPAAPPTMPAKVNSLETYGSLFSYKSKPAAASTKVVNATPVLKPAAPTPPGGE